MIAHLVPYLETISQYALVWGPLLVLLFMTIESSFIPFPSEIVIVPAAFMAARGEFWPGAEAPLLALLAVVLAGIAGSWLGATINYFLARWIGRPVLHRWGHWFFMPEDKLDKAEAAFRRYGDMSTFICRLIPVVRQLISIPAGLSGMNFLRFSVFTTAGAGIWVCFLAILGYVIGRQTDGMGYAELLTRSKEMLHDNLLWIVLVALFVGVLYWFISRRGRSRESTV